MRPRGEIRDVLAVTLKGGHGTTRDIATRSGVGYSAAQYTLRNMVQAGEAIRLDPVRVPGVKRPVPVYGLADDEAANEGGFNWDLVTCWAQWPERA